MSFEYNPNEPRKQFEYATAIQYRTPTFKAHHKLGHARAAITNHRRPAILFRWENDKWKEIWRIEEWPRRKNSWGGTSAVRAKWKDEELVFLAN